MFYCQQIRSDSTERNGYDLLDGAQGFFFQKIETTGRKEAVLVACEVRLAHPQFHPGSASTWAHMNWTITIQDDIDPIEAKNAREKLTCWGSGRPQIHCFRCGHRDLKCGQYASRIIGDID